MTRALVTLIRGWSKFDEPYFPEKKEKTSNPFFVIFNKLQNIQQRKEAKTTQEIFILIDFHRTIIKSLLFLGVSSIIRYAGCFYFTNWINSSDFDECRSLIALNLRTDSTKTRNANRMLSFSILSIILYEVHRVRCAKSVDLSRLGLLTLYICGRLATLITEFVTLDEWGKFKSEFPSSLYKFKLRRNETFDHRNSSGNCKLNETRQGTQHHLPRLLRRLWRRKILWKRHNALGPLRRLLLSWRLDLL